MVWLCYVGEAHYICAFAETNQISTSLNNLYWHSILSQSLKLCLHSPHFVMIPELALMELSCIPEAMQLQYSSQVKLRDLNWLQYLSQLVQNLLIWVFPSVPSGNIFSRLWTTVWTSCSNKLHTHDINYM